MTMSNDARLRAFNRQMLRSAFQSLFWHVLLSRKKEQGFTLKALADKLGINKSYVSRSFSAPPNWTIDKLSDMADAVGIDLVVEARDRVTGKVYTPSGSAPVAATSTVFDERLPVSSTFTKKDPLRLVR